MLNSYICIVLASELSSKYKNLYRDIEHLKDWRKSYIDTRESFVHTYAQLVFRRKQLMSELSLIYPVLQVCFYISSY